MTITPATRAGRCWLWARYVLRRHEMTDQRVIGMRWHWEATDPYGTVRYSLGTLKPNGVFVGWEWEVRPPA